MSRFGSQSGKEPVTTSLGCSTWEHCWSCAVCPATPQPFTPTLAETVFVELDRETSMLAT